MFYPRTSVRLTKSICTTSEINCQTISRVIWPIWEHCVSCSCVAKTLNINSVSRETLTSALKILKSSYVSKRCPCSESRAVYTMQSTLSNFTLRAASRRRSSVTTSPMKTLDTSRSSAAWMCLREKLWLACASITRHESPISRMCHLRRMKAPRSNSRVARRMHMVAGSARISWMKRESWVSMGLSRAAIVESYLR